MILRKGNTPLTEIEKKQLFSILWEQYGSLENASVISGLSTQTLRNIANRGYGLSENIKKVRCKILYNRMLKKTIFKH